MGNSASTRHRHRIDASEPRRSLHAGIAGIATGNRTILTSTNKREPYEEQCKYNPAPCHAV